MVDKRQCRKVNREAFCAAIRSWRAAHPPTGKAAQPDGSESGTERAPLASLRGSGQATADAAGAETPSALARQASGSARRLRAIVRKRPLFQHEVARGEFDVVSVRGLSSVALHQCCMQPDLKRMFVKHTVFSVGDVFDERVDTPEVCERGVAPLLTNVLAGGCSTLFMYGQTGSGKTHTMAGIERYASDFLLGGGAPAPTGGDDGPDGADGAEAEVLGHLSFFEIAGSRCIELLGEQYGRELALKQDADGRVQPVNVTRVPVANAASLLELIAVAKSRRATEATGANAVSSRSHAVCQLTLARAAAPPPAAQAAGGKGGGRRRPKVHPAVLTLVDCAGTERKEDSMWHDADRRKEGAEINQSLHALKECMRHWVAAQDGKTAFIPFRDSALTRVLADSFMRADTLITVVGTLSPSASDTEHTHTTLKTVAAVAGTESQVREVKRDVKPIVEAPAAHTIVPKLWDEGRLRAWLASTVSSRAEPLAPLLSLVPAGTTGKQIMRMSAMQIRQVWGAPTELASAVFYELREATKRAEAAKNKQRHGARAADQRKRAGQHA